MGHRSIEIIEEIIDPNGGGVKFRIENLKLKIEE